MRSDQLAFDDLFADAHKHPALLRSPLTLYHLKLYN